MSKRRSTGPEASDNSTNVFHFIYHISLHDHSQHRPCVQLQDQKFGGERSRALFVSKATVFDTLFLDALILHVLILISLHSVSSILSICAWNVTARATPLCTPLSHQIGLVNSPP